VVFNGRVSGPSPAAHPAAQVPDAPARATSIDAPTRAALVAHLAPLGVAEGYINAAGAYVSTPTATLALVSGDFDLDAPNGAGAPLICTPGRYHPELFGTVIMENGHTYRAVGFVNQAGYHILYTDTGLRRLVLDELRAVQPEHDPLPEPELVEAASAIIAVMDGLQVQWLIDPATVNLGEASAYAIEAIVDRVAAGASGTTLL